MRVFLYEFVTGGGTLTSGLPLGGALLREGRAMITGLAADFAELAGTRVDVLRDTRLDDFKLPTATVHEVRGADAQQQQFECLAGEADWTLVIAPELGGLLLQCCRQVQLGGGRLLSPDSTFVEIAGDKRTTHRRWREDGVPAPIQKVLRPGQGLPQDFGYPAVIKPRYGAGSFNVRLVRSCDDEAGQSALDSWRCLQSYCRGTAASVAVLAGPGGFRTLPACRQRLSDDGCFRYLGGDLPLKLSLQLRAAEVARQVVRSMPETAGYFGIDMVLGDRQDGSQDVAIEVNPRMTTSYIGLRQLARRSLAGAMLAVASGRSYELSFANQHLEFSAV